jgi:hypothetical protein
MGTHIATTNCQRKRLVFVALKQGIKVHDLVIRLPSDLPKANLTAPDTRGLTRPHWGHGSPRPPTGRARRWSHPKCPEGGRGQIVHPTRCLRHLDPAAPAPCPRRRARAFRAENAPLERFRGAKAPPPFTQPKPLSWRPSMFWQDPPHKRSKRHQYRPTGAPNRTQDRPLRRLYNHQ